MSLKYYARVNKRTGRLFGHILRRPKKPARNYRLVDYEPDCSGCEGVVPTGFKIQNNTIITGTLISTIGVYGGTEMTIKWSPVDEFTYMTNNDYDFTYPIDGIYNITVSFKKSISPINSIRIGGASSISDLRGYIDITYFQLNNCNLSSFPQLPSSITSLQINSSDFGSGGPLPSEVIQFAIDNSPDISVGIIDDMFVQFDNNGKMNGSVQIAAPTPYASGASLTARNNLISKGWSIFFI